MLESSYNGYYIEQAVALEPTKEFESLPRSTNRIKKIYFSYIKKKFEKSTRTLKFYILIVYSLP